MRVRMKVNNKSLVKGAGLISNTVMLAANTYLLTSGIKNNLVIKKQERISNALQTTAEIASAVAGLTKVITETIDVYHAEEG